jgi:hypothetical protein
MWKVRWFSTNFARKEFEKVTNRDALVYDENEHLFRAYGGAYVKLEGEVVDRFINPDGTIRLRLEVNVTILDHADFSETGWARLRELFPGGKLRDIFVAGGLLQKEKYMRNPKKPADFWHQIEFKSNYHITLP